MKLLVDDTMIRFGMSNRRLSKLTGISASYIQRMRDPGSNVNPSINIMCRLAVAFDVKIDDLVMYGYRAKKE